jgi:hypothetical protein
MLKDVSLSGLVFIVLATGPSVRVDSKLATDVGFLRAIKIHSMTFFRGEIKLSALCCKILWHIKEPCRV